MQTPIMQELLIKNFNYHPFPESSPPFTLKKVFTGKTSYPNWALILTSSLRLRLLSTCLCLVHLGENLDAVSR